MFQYSLFDANANVSFGMPLSSCFDFCRYRYKHVNYRVRDRNDTDCTDHDYNLSSLKGKKSINKGRWTKEEVSVLCLRFNEQQPNLMLSQGLTAYCIDVTPAGAVKLSICVTKVV